MTCQLCCGGFSEQPLLSWFQQWKRSLDWVSEMCRQISRAPIRMGRTDFPGLFLWLNWLKLKKGDNKFTRWMKSCGTKNHISIEETILKRLFVPFKWLLKLTYKCSAKLLQRFHEKPDGTSDVWLLFQRHLSCIVTIYDGLSVMDAFGNSYSKGSSNSSRFSLLVSL